MANAVATKLVRQTISLSDTAAKSTKLVRQTIRSNGTIASGTKIVRQTLYLPSPGGGGGADNGRFFLLF